MEKKQIVNIAYWIMIIAVILTCVFVVFYLKSNSQQCLADPKAFYEAKTQMQCFCSDLKLFRK